MRRILALVLAVWSVVCVGGCARDTVDTRVFLVRHAEVLADGPDPGLTPEGKQWAQELAAFAKDQGVGAVVSTPYRRTVQTATPAAEALGVGVMVVPVGTGPDGVESYGRRVADLIRSDAGTRVWLVVGHSNTVPAVIDAFGGGGVTIDEDAFGDVFVVDLRKSGGVGVRRGLLPGDGGKDFPGRADGV